MKSPFVSFVSESLGGGVVGKSSWDEKIFFIVG